MVPGWIAGEYDAFEGLVDLAALARRAGVRLVLGACSGIDPEARIIEVQGGQQIAFDIASIDTGGIGRASDVLGDDARLLDIRPIGRFVESLDALRSLTFGKPAHVAVIGGGAGGAELAFALRNYAGAAHQPDVSFVTGAAGLLPELSASVRANVADELSKQKIPVIADDGQIVDGNVMAGERTLERVDLIIAALGSGAPPWPRASGITCDAAGFVAVDGQQRSISHPHIFATGDVAARQDRAIPHSGVHAVFAGPILAANLRAAAAGSEPSQTYRARWNNLYLMSTGRGEAIASYGPFTAKGRWVAKLKRWIDTRWITKYARLAENG
jgi:NADH dehydrogenase FAD-containing subunit